MASYATIPADIETNESAQALVVNKQTPLKRLAALASFLLGVLAATAVQSASTPLDVFDGNGAPSDPNYLLFSDADRLLDSLWDRSVVG